MKRWIFTLLFFCSIHTIRICVCAYLLPANVQYPLTPFKLKNAGSMPVFVLYLLLFPYFMSCYCSAGTSSSLLYCVSIAGMSWKVNSHYLYLQNGLSFELATLPEKPGFSLPSQSDFTWGGFPPAFKYLKPIRKLYEMSLWWTIGQLDKNMLRAFFIRSLWLFGFHMMRTSAFLVFQSSASREPPNHPAWWANVLILEKQSISRSHRLIARVCGQAIMWWNKFRR